MLLYLLVLDRFEDCLLLQVDNPPGVEPIEDLPGVLGGLHELGLLLGELVAVLLREDEPLLSDEPGVGQIAAVLGVRIVPDGIR